MWPHRRQPTRLPCPWDSPDKNTGVGCHFLLQCMKVKSESEVTQSCPTLRDPMDCSPPGSSVHGIFQAGVPEWVAMAFSTVIGQFRSNWRKVNGNLKGPQWCGNIAWLFPWQCCFLLQFLLALKISLYFNIFIYVTRGSSQPRNWTRISCIVGFFTHWAISEAQLKYVCSKSISTLFF